MRDDHERLRDVLEAIARIERYASRGRQTFEADELIQNWMVRNLQIIGEACSGLSRGFRSAHPEVQWTQIVGMRNILVHDYFSIDTDLVWQAIERDLPALRVQVETLLRTSGGSSWHRDRS
ncbi:MAG: DUF86 domain-containing protein [Candidatus Riflebacteria bacterium]|nr:DUF86 domain-containing protein [Candidatus Riflebacteria bacterium]